MNHDHDLLERMENSAVSHAMKGAKRLRELLELAKAQQEWIDAVPEETILPAMPGYDRDLADRILATDLNNLARPTHINKDHGH